MLNRVGHSIRLAHLDGRRPCLQPRRPPHATSPGAGGGASNSGRGDEAAARMDVRRRLQKRPSSKAPSPDPATGSCGGATTGVATGHPAERGGDGRPRVRGERGERGTRRADDKVQALGKDSQRRSGDAERNTMARTKASPSDGLFTSFFYFFYLPKFI